MKLIFIICFSFGIFSRRATGDNILVLGGIMKSHHLAMVPVVEQLATRGHNVTFALPNTDEGREFFPNGVAGAHLLYMGRNDWSFAKLTVPDLKNLAWYEQIAAWAKLLWNYRDMIDKPMFSMVDDFANYIHTSRPDCVFSSLASFGPNHKLHEMLDAPPMVMFFSTQPQPEFILSDIEMLCRYPNMMQPDTLESLKSSLLSRVKNRMTCQFLQLYMAFATREINAVMVTRGMSPVSDFTVLLNEPPLVVAAGGPPITRPMPIPGSWHMVGVVEKAVPTPIESPLLRWLDSAATAGAPVMYVSMGTKYELSDKTCSQLVAALEVLTRTKGVRVLWSLRKQQQEALRALLPASGEQVRLELFTPQPEVLAHKAVTVFLSHCGWGGVTDSLSAGVPTLAYPGFSEQFVNALALVDIGAGILVHGDFGNLVHATQRLLNEQSFAIAAKSAGEQLGALGGLDRVVEIVEAASKGTYLPPAAEVRSFMETIDPYFLTPQPLEKVISCGIAVLLLAITLLSSFCCCRCFCRCLCYPSKPSQMPKQKYA